MCRSRGSLLFLPLPAGTGKRWGPPAGSRAEGESLSSKEAAVRLPARCQLGAREAGRCHPIGQPLRGPPPTPRRICCRRARARCQSAPEPRRAAGSPRGHGSPGPRPTAAGPRLPPARPSRCQERHERGSRARPPAPWAAAAPAPTRRAARRGGEGGRRGPGPAPLPAGAGLPGPGSRGAASRPRPASSASGVGSAAEAERGGREAGGWARFSAQWASVGPRRAPPPLPLALPPLRRPAGPQLSLKAAGLRPAAAAGGERGSYATAQRRPFVEK